VRAAAAAAAAFRIGVQPQRLVSVRTGGCVCWLGVQFIYLRDSGSSS